MTTPDPRPTNDGKLRRTAFKGGLAALFALGLAHKAVAAPAPRKKAHDDAPNELLDKVAISQLLLLERWARETHNTDIEGPCFTPDAWVEVSWYKGTAADFVATGKSPLSATTASFDSLSPPLIWINKDRATADASCAVHQALKLDGVEVVCISHMRLLWRVERINGQWLIAGLRGYYIRDTLQTNGPNQALALDETKLAGYRLSYRYLSYVLSANGREVGNDLPGSDEPDTVAALRATEQAWLDQV